MLRLLPTATVDRAVHALRESAMSVNAGYGRPNEHAVDLRDRYVQWWVAIEPRLLDLFQRQDVLEMFESPRHRDICAMPVGNQLVPLINAELRTKNTAFETEAARLETKRDNMRAAPGLPVVVDSNALLHALPPEQVGWNTLRGQPLRLILPLRTVEEIDAKKYSNSERLRDRARSLLPWLERTLGEDPTAPTAVAPDGRNNGARGTTIEVYPSPRPRFRPADADEEILDIAHEVRQFHGTATVLTGDTSMRIRARSEGLDAFGVAARWTRRETKAGEHDD